MHGLYDHECMHQLMHRGIDLWMNRYPCQRDAVVAVESMNFSYSVYLRYVSPKPIVLTEMNWK